MSDTCYPHQHPLFEKQSNKEAIVGVEFWAWKMPSSRKTRMTKASPRGPCEQRSSAAHAAEARGRAVLIYCWASSGPQLLHHAIWAYSHELSQGERLPNNNLRVLM